MPQLQLPIFPNGTTEINANLAVEKREDQITYFYGHLPIFKHDVDDLPTFRMITSQICANGNAKQAEICKAFGVAKISVMRGVKLYRKKGISGFYQKRSTRGAVVLTSEVLKKAQELLDEGLDSGEVSLKLNIKKDTLRKAVKAGRLHSSLKKK
jgi:hypothetical protein